MSPVGDFQSALLPENHRDRFAMLEWYYQGIAYRMLNQGILDRNHEGKAGGVRELENPMEQGVEFHADHMFPGTLEKALPIQVDATGNENIVPAIRRVWRQSNWGYNKQTYARWLPLYGDAFLHAAQTERRRFPYIELIHPSNVSMFDKDEMGNLIYLWMETEVPKSDGKGFIVRNEEWDRDAERMRVWYAAGYGADWEQRALVAREDIPDEEPFYEKGLSTFGIDFVPHVHTVFMPDVSDPDGWGVSAAARKIAQVDELSRMVTTIHDRFFRYGKPDKAVMAGEANRGAPKMERNDRRPGPSSTRADGSIQTMEDGEKIYQFPGMSHMEYLIANVPYEAGLSMIEARQKKLAENWAELRFYEDVDQGDPSGIARRNRLAPAVSRTIEARGNAESALIRVQKMCLTLGTRVPELEEFRNIGTFERGDYDHHFTEREVIPVSEEERQTAIQIKLQNAATMLILGRAPSVVQTELGWDEDEVAPNLRGGNTQAGETGDPNEPSEDDLSAVAARLAGLTQPTRGSADDPPPRGSSGGTPTTG